MKLVSRKAVERDYFTLRDMFILSNREDRLNRNWTYERLDWVRFHYFQRKDMKVYQWPDFCHIWESEKGDFIAAVLFEVPGFCSLQILPEYMNQVNLEDMLKKAEEMQIKLFYPKSGKKVIEFEIDERDKELISIFKNQGYRRIDNDYMIVFDQLNLQQDFPVIELPEGFCIRSVKSYDDYLKKNEAHCAAFSVGDKYSEDNFKYLKEAPGYIQELDLILEYGDRFVADCGAWYDDYNKTGSIEPLGVHPDFQKRGLGKAIIYEAFRRLRDMGALWTDMHAEESNRAFYTSVGYKAVAKKHIYQKELS